MIHLLYQLPPAPPPPASPPPPNPPKPPPPPPQSPPPQLEPPESPREFAAELMIEPMIHGRALPPPPKPPPPQRPPRPPPPRAARDINHTIINPMIKIRQNPKL